MHICCGIVTYNPDIGRLKENIDAIIGQVGKVYIFDNASKNVEKIYGLIENTQVKLIDNCDNYGIAFALNELVKVANEDKYDWIITLDQDTICPKDIVTKMSENIGEKVGIICPAVHYETGRKQGGKTNNVESIAACMTSGSLTNIKAIKKVGGYNNDYYIDFVDNEICMKLRINGYSVLRCNTCVMFHQLGEMRSITIPFLGKRKVSVHNPWRLYYMTRNNYVFIRQYKEYLDIKKEWMKLIYILFNEVCLSNQKIESIQYIYKGLVDAKKGILGKRV